MLGGPTMNLVIYLVLTVCLLGILGTPHDDSTTTVGTVSQCVFPANSPRPRRAPAPCPTRPRSRRACSPRTRSSRSPGTPITTWEQAVKIIEASPNKALTMVVQRDGKDVSLTITPVQNLKYANDTGTKTKEAGFIGVSPASHHYYQAVGIDPDPRPDRRPDQHWRARAGQLPGEDRQPVEHRLPQQAA